MQPTSFGWNADSQFNDSAARGEEIGPFTTKERRSIYRANEDGKGRSPSPCL
jgi:hypothetical protein